MAGCAGTPIQTGFLGNYSGMTNQFDLDAVRIAPGTSLTPYETLVISPIDSKFAGHYLSEKDKGNILKKFEENLRTEMARYFKNITSDSTTVGSGEVLKLDLAVTELKPTDVATNLVVGFGAGNATGSMEGKFVDFRTGQELIAFMDRKKGSPFTKKEFDAGTKFPNWSRLRYLYLFTEIWSENVGNIVEMLKK